jgi:DNA primase
MYWNTRSIEKDAYIKSFNAPSRPTEYGKNNTIFNLNWAKYSDKIVITEGVFDALTIGGDSGVGTFGKMITTEQVDLLIRETEERQLPIYLYLDRDAIDQMIKSAHRIKAKAPNRPLYFVLGDKKRDANDLGPEKVQELIDQAFPADSEGELKLKFANV